jgi:glycosyltransferase involved in cell wall biosynthesis
VRLRVLQFAWRLSPGGGVASTIRDALACLDHDRFDLHLCTIRSFSEEDCDRPLDGVQLHSLEIDGPATPSVRLEILARFRGIARSVDPDVLHTHSGVGWYSLPWRMTAGRRAAAILEVHDAPDRPGTSLGYRTLEGLLLRRFRYRALAHSRSVCDGLRMAHRIDEDAIDLVPIGIDTDVLTRPTVGRMQWRSEAGIPADAPVVLYVARLVQPKNIPLFVDVAAEVARAVPTARFVLVGDGPERGHAEQTVRARGLADAVRVLGFRDDLVNIYHAADLFLSTSDYEGFGIATLEAMAAGLPVVATSVGGTPELVEENRTGRLARPGDRQALVAALVDLLGDELRRRRYGSAAARRAREHFDASLMARRYESLYRTASDRQGSPASAARAASPVRSTRRRRVFLLKYYDSAEARDVADAWRLPYGIHWLSDAGIELHWSDAEHRDPWTRPRVRSIVRRFERFTAPFLGTFLGTRAIARADAVLTIFESQANVLALLRSMHVRPFARPRLVVISCWLAAELQRSGRARRALYRLAYRSVDHLVYFSNTQTEIYRTLLQMPESRLDFVPFGVDHELFSPVDVPEDGSVLAVGRDRGRDWATLFDAVRGSDLRVRLASRREDVAGLVVPTNVELLGFVDPAEYRQLVAQSSVVVVATHARVYPTGQTVALEAMSMGKCCVITDTPAMRDYVDGEHALLVPPHDALALRRALERATGDAALRRAVGEKARCSVLDRFTAERMWRSVATLL